ncbi:MAG: hypothetical protein J1E33_06330 [Alistipes sp.]|nr:hypothetical protein [Alistipes sp.]
MRMISNADYERLLTIGKALAQCRGSTTKESNALRNLKLLYRKLNNRKHKTNEQNRRNTQ